MLELKKGFNRITGIEELSSITKSPRVAKYNSEKEGFKDKSYFTFVYQGKAMAIHEDDTFTADALKGDLFSVDVEMNEEGQLSFISHVSRTKYNNLKKGEIETKMIDVEFVATKSKLSAEQLESLASM